MTQQASTAIKDAVCDSGTPVAKCDFCGRLHYATTGFIEDEELDRLEESRKAAPAFFIAHNDRDALSIGWIEGKRYVYDCDCKESEERLAKIEAFLWSNQLIVSKYYRNKVKALKDEAATLEGMMP